MPSLIDLNNHSCNILPTLSIQDPVDYSIVKGLAKIALEFTHVRSLCKSNLAAFFSEILKFIADNNLPPHIIKYASEIFLNESRINSYFKTNFIHFVLKIEEIEGENVYFTDISSILKQIFDKSSISNHLLFQKSSSCLFSFLDGSSAPSSSNIYIPSTLF